MTLAKLHGDRLERLEEAQRRAAWTSRYPHTKFEELLSADVLFLLRDIKRLERLAPAALPFEDPDAGDPDVRSLEDLKARVKRIGARGE